MSTKNTTKNGENDVELITEDKNTSSEGKKLSLEDYLAQNEVNYMIVAVYQANAGENADKQQTAEEWKNTFEAVSKKEYK